MFLLLFLAMVAACSLAVFGYFGFALWKEKRKSVIEEVPEPVRQLPQIAGSATGWFNVLSGLDLLEHCKTSELLKDIERQSRLSHAVFERDFTPALVAYAEFVQLTPASEAHHHAHIGGLIAHTFEVVLGALTYRNGTLLPLHANTETIDAQRDHWTYAAFFAALLHDVGKVLTDLQIDVRDGKTAPARRWMPMSGAMTMSRAVEYEVRFAPKSERDYQAHQRLALVLLQAIVPANALAFIGREKGVLTALTKYLGGDEGMTDEGAKALADIVKRADQASVSRNLASGSRQRFVTATAVPLNELLMQSIRYMLRDGTKLPLNRNGAAGWVFDGAVWFVAKRLADTVRKHVQEHYPDESIPGGNKNDRLFDTWQDFGLIEPNPSKGGAIWRVIVKGPDYELPPFPVLKFPLHRLFDAPSAYPAPMQGELIVVGGDEAAVADPDVDATEGEEGDAPSAQSSEAIVQGRSDTTDGPQTTARQVEDLMPPELDAANCSVPAPVATAQKSSAASKQSPEGINKQAFKVAAPKPQQPKKKATPALLPAAPAPEPHQEEAPKAIPPAPEAPKPVAPVFKQQDKAVEKPAAPAENLGADFLPTDADVSTYEAEKREQRSTTEQSASKEKSASVLTRVAPRAPAPPPLTTAKPSKEPDPLAIEFIQWVQQGLANGSITYNQADSMVHIVPEGIALVSPRIFREYGVMRGLTAQSDDLVIQRKVIAAGWHAAAPKSNILHYAVISEGKRKGKLSAVVLRDPHQWLTEVPPANVYLQRCDPIASAQPT